MYGTGLLVFHIYCDLNQVPEQLRCPTNQSLLTAFIFSYAGTYSGSTLSNFVAGLRAWHILHGQPWQINPNKMRSLLEGVARLAPPMFKCLKCLPIKCNTLLSFITYMDLSASCNAAIFACITITFYSVSHLGEFTVSALKKFNPTMHITPSHVTYMCTRPKRPRSYCIMHTCNEMLLHRRRHTMHAHPAPIQPCRMAQQPLLNQQSRPQQSSFCLETPQGPMTLDQSRSHKPHP